MCALRALRARQKSFRGPHLARGPYVVHAWCRAFETLFVVVTAIRSDRNNLFPSKKSFYLRLYVYSFYAFNWIFTKKILFDSNLFSKKRLFLNQVTDSNFSIQNLNSVLGLFSFHAKYIYYQYIICLIYFSIFKYKIILLLRLLSRSDYKLPENKRAQIILSFKRHC